MLALLVLALVSAVSAAWQPPASTSPSIAIRTLIARREPMLDALEAGDRLIVLGPESIAWYSRADALAGGRAAATIRITHARPWPRDLRGRLRTTPAGFDALLPGVVCRGTLQPFTASCVEDRDSWLGLDSGGITPNRNFFTTPEGLVFYGAATLAPEGDARWLAVDTGGALVFLNASRTIVGRGEAADDVASVVDPCGGENYVVTVASTARSNDELRLHGVAGTRLLDRGSFPMPGPVLALWARADARSATAIVQQSSGVYEAHSINLACAR